MHTHAYSYTHAGVYKVKNQGYEDERASLVNDITRNEQDIAAVTAVINKVHEVCMCVCMHTCMHAFVCVSTTLRLWLLQLQGL